jgi:hypothetical protein
MFLTKSHEKPKVLTSGNRFDPSQDTPVLADSSNISVVDSPEKLNSSSLVIQKQPNKSQISIELEGE